MAVQVDFLFDFASPNAYLSHQVIPGIEERTGARFNYVPVLLGGIFKATNNQAPMIAFGGVRNKLAYEMRETERFVARHKLTKYKMNPHFPVNTLALMRAATAAKLDGALAPFVEAGFRAMWEDGIKMDDPAAMHAALVAAGLDADRLMARAQEADVKTALLTETEAAVERGAFGIPSFFVGNEMYFGKDRLRDLEDEVAEASRAA